MSDQPNKDRELAAWLRAFATELDRSSVSADFINERAFLPAAADRLEQLSDPTAIVRELVEALEEAVAQFEAEGYAAFANRLRAALPQEPTPEQSKEGETSG